MNFVKNWWPVISTCLATLGGLLLVYQQLDKNQALILHRLDNIDTVLEKFEDRIDTLEHRQYTHTHANGVKTNGS